VASANVQGLVVAAAAALVSTPAFSASTARLEMGNLFRVRAP
jgi:hypothetical protein